MAHVNDVSHPLAPGSRRPGGRTAENRQAVLAATRALLVEQGAVGMRIGVIADRAGVHRSSIYRRWQSPAGIVADLAQEIATRSEPPNTESLSGDLWVVAERLAANLTGDGPVLVKNLLAWPDPEVRALLTKFWHDRHGEVAGILRHYDWAADAAVVTRLLAGPLYYQALIEGLPITHDTVEAAVAAALAVVSTVE